MIGSATPVTEVLIARLIDQSDEVRIVETERDAAARWRALGAHVAVGSPVDADLIERAAQYARTIVVIDDGVNALEATVSAAIEGGLLASSGVRLVVCAGTIAASIAATIERSGLSYVLLRTGAGAARRRRRISRTAIAAAIDAADDLAGEPRLDLELDTAVAWSELDVPHP
ncbi:MAG: hypothetical protein ABR529_04420 [Actinomycetota bacterium]